MFSGAIKFGGVMQVGDAFGRVEDSVAMLVETFRDFAEWRSAVRRLADFEESLKRCEGIQSRAAPVGDGVLAEGLTLLTPEGRVLIDDVCMEIREGERLLFTGASGLGKSTLFRAFAGIWPFYRGGLQRPRSEEGFFLPQTCYLPQGTLRRALLFPREEGASDEVLNTYLRKLGLAALCDKLDVEEDWQKILSPGEAQRISVIRALLRKPKWLFLDEATSALDGGSQAKVYSLLRDELGSTAVISVAHRKDVEQFHDRVVELGESEKVSEPV